MSKAIKAVPAVPAVPAVKVKPIVLLIGAPAIEKAITAIKAAGPKLDNSIQLAGLSIINHVELSGDTTLADRIFNAMAKGSRRNALAEWFITFGKMYILDGKSEDKAVKAAIKAGRVFQFDKNRKTDMHGAESKPWFECKKEANVSDTFDVQAAFDSFMKRVASAQKAGMKMEHAELLEKLTKAVA